MPAQLPDSLDLLPPPPAPTSSAQERDEQIRAQAQHWREGARWHLAAQDADLDFPQAAQTFNCALGIAINPRQTPHLYQMLRRMQVDAGASTRKAKAYYNRIRPFAAHNATSCFPRDDADLQHNGAYPSGHTTIGWSWALALTSLAPQQGEAVLKRGLAFGDSRVVCDVHWQSDVDAGRIMGAAVFAQLQGNPAFQADMRAARREIQAARAAGHTPEQDCAAQTRALDER